LYDVGGIIGGIVGGLVSVSYIQFFLNQSNTFE
jgi:hypothetical protein